MSALILGLLAMLNGQGTPAAVSPFAPLRVYAGEWSFTKTGEKTSHLTSRCREDGTYFTCQQIIDGKAVVLLVYVSTDGVAGERPGMLYCQSVLPDGHATGREEVTMDGDHWTYLGKDPQGKPRFRTENYFLGPDHIRYEEFEADAAGVWKKTGAGDEVRVK